MQADILWKAAVLTAMVFIGGIALGVWLDGQRASQISAQTTDTDIRWNDARLLSLYYQQLAGSGGAFCKFALESNLAFNDKIYQEGLVLERYEAVNRFAPELLQEKRRYALLQFQFLLNSMELKADCNASYHVLVYFYDHYNGGKEAVQNAQSQVLMELKNKCGGDLMLIPLPLDLDISSISLLAAQHNITSAPSILLDDKVFVGLTGKEKLIPLLGCGN